MTPTNITILTLTLLLAAMTVAFFRLRRRHRELRHTLNRVSGERDTFKWQLATTDRSVSAGSASGAAAGKAVVQAFADTPAPGRFLTWPFA